MKLKKYTLSFCMLLMPSLSLNAQNCDYLQAASDNCSIFSSPYGGHGLWTEQFFPPTDIHNCTQGSVWELIFEDVFNGNALDQQKWLPNYPFGSYVECEPNIAVAPNDYNSNIEVSNGTLKLLAKQETLTTRAFCCPPCCWPNCTPQQLNTCILSDGLPNLRTFFFTGGMIHSHHLSGQGGPFSAGRFEIRCKIPKVDGVWPSFWLFGACGQEIDVFEFGNLSFAEDILTASKRPALSYHKQRDCNPSLPVCGDTYNYFGCDDYSDAFHVFSVEWDHFKITWKIDGNIVRVISGLTIKGSAGNCSTIGSFVDECSAADGEYCTNPIMPTGEDMFILANLKVTDFSHYTESPCIPPYYRTQNWIPLTRGVFPAVFEIDYIRVYKRTLLPLCDANDITVTSSPFNQYLSQTVLTAKNSITTSGTVNIGADKHWVAGNYIELNDGFETVLGVDFTAEIGDCDATNLRIIPNNENNPIVLQSAVSAGKNPPSKEETKAVSVKENNISPNPSSGIFTLISSHEVQNIEVRDMLGNVVYEQKVNNNTINTDIDLSNQPKGIYILQVKDRNKIYTEKIVLQ